MSSLWTPGGEVPVGRDRQSEGGSEQPPPPRGPEGDDQGTEEAARVRAQMEQMQRQLLEAPAGDVIAQHLVAFYELAAMHLSQDEPRVGDARLAIDAIEAVLDALGERLGEAGAGIRGALPQLKLAVVEAADRPKGGPEGGSEGASGP